MRFSTLILSLVFTLGALLPSLHARLGETEFECNDRYGDGQDDHMKASFPLMEGARHREFHYQGWLIRIAFVDGHAVREEYMKSGSKDGPLIKDDELKAILEGEKGTGTWKMKPAEMSLAGLLLPSTAQAKTWMRSDGALAILRPGGSIVRVETKDVEPLDKRIKAEKEEGRKKAVPKF